MKQFIRQSDKKVFQPSANNPVGLWVRIESVDDDEIDTVKWYGYSRPSQNELYASASKGHSYET